MSTEIKNNYYEVLEVGPAATQHDITIAYEKAKRTYSPENPALFAVFSQDEALSLRALIEEAFCVLSNQTYRDVYEKRLQAKTYADSDLSFDAIKKASEDLFSNGILNNKPTPAAPDKEAQQFEADPKFESEISQREQWSGDFLKKVREYKKVSINHLHEETKVNPWYLTALETMEPKKLPAPVFVRGYVIQLAKSLGLNEKAVAESYMKIYKKKLEHE